MRRGLGGKGLAARCLPSFSSDLHLYCAAGGLNKGEIWPQAKGRKEVSRRPEAGLGGQFQYKIDLWDPDITGRGRVQQVPAYKGHLYREI